MIAGKETLFGLLVQVAALDPHAPAVRDAHGVWSYQELVDTALDIAAWLRRQGVSRGDRVMVALPNSRHLVALLYGGFAAGAAVVPVGAGARPYQVAAIAASAEPRLLVAETTERFAELPPAGGNRRTATLDGMLAELTSDGLTSDVEPDDIALLIYTSGSTAGPKGVVSRHRQAVFAVRAIAERLGYRPGDVVGCRLPFSFDYGLYQTFLCAEAGAELALIDGRDELSAFRAMITARPTVLPLVPPVAQTLIRLAARGDVELPVRLITNTGAELTADTAQGLRRVFPQAALVPMYGMTECKRISIAAPDADLVKPGTVGRALTGTDVAIVGDDDEVLPAGQVGEIVVSGPHVMDGYWRDPEASAGRFRLDPHTGRTRLYTGDFGWMDPDGELRIVGRRDDVFKRRGVRTSVNEIEAAALDIAEVEEAAAALVGPDRRCVLWVRAAIPPEHVLKGISERLEPARTPDHCLIVADLPRLPSGKVDKNRLKAEYVGNR
ncbi:class I adenylate-forming enzyme family protein [Actinoplanes sp. NPDC051346]|uniref:class I adenylate-forming enzyme family protein n=1 Tax=Actinoplanes sp. NPDC051346 TaxID=3155048 RepID=UPI003424EF94